MASDPANDIAFIEVLESDPELQQLDRTLHAGWKPRDARRASFRQRHPHIIRDCAMGSLSGAAVMSALWGGYFITSQTAAAFAHTLP